jgi:cobalt-zinc-cadmium efflux system protein
MTREHAHPGGQAHGPHGGRHVHLPASIEGKFVLSILVNVSITLAELIGGILANSLGLISDALHNFSDVLALLMSYLGERVKERPHTPRMTFGYRRLETLIALVNAVSLGGIAIFIVLEAVARWKHPQPVAWRSVLLIGAMALAGNVISVLILRSEKDRNLNVKSAFLHLLFDAISSVGVMASALIIAATGWVSADLVVSLVISLMIVGGSSGLLKSIYTILMEGVPHGLDIAQIQGSLEAFPEIRQVHHVHVWSISLDRAALSAHVVIERTSLPHLDVILDKATRALKELHNLDHVTLQPEILFCADPDGVPESPPGH